jgi:hypothetical protein
MGCGVVVTETCGFEGPEYKGAVVQPGFASVPSAREIL